MSLAGQRFSISFLLLLLCLAWVGIASIVTAIAIAKEVGSSIKFSDKNRGRINMSRFVLNQIWLCFLLHICGGFTLNLVSAASACTHAPLQPAAYSPPLHPQFPAIMDSRGPNIVQRCLFLVMQGTKPLYVLIVEYLILLFIKSLLTFSSFRVLFIYVFIHLLYKFTVRLHRQRQILI